MITCDRCRTIGHHRRRAQHVRELPHVARPRIGLEEARHFAAEYRCALGAALAQDAAGERGQVGALAQWRQLHDEPVQVVIQVFAEATGFDHLAQVAVRGDDHGHVDVQRLAAAQRRDAALLQRAQQPRLQRERHVADLVEEQRAAIGLQDLADRALAARAGEGAVRVAEEFGFDQRLGDRRAVHGHERLPRALRVVVDGARQQRLAGAGVAEQQDRNVAVDHAAHLADDGPDLRVAGVELAQAGGAVGCGAAGVGRRSAGRGSGGLGGVPDGPRAGLRSSGRGDRDGDRRGLAQAVPRGPVESGAHMAQRTVRQVQRQRRGQRRAEVIDEQRGRGAQQARDRVHAHRRAGQADVVERTAVRADDAAVARHRQNAFHQRADEIDAAVQVQPHHLAEIVRETVVLDHAGRHLDEAHRVLVKAPVVARHVEHTEDVAARIENRRSLATQELVGVQEVLVGIDHDGPLVDQRGADGVRALRRFGPVHARLQRHLRGLGKKVVVADRVQDGAAGIGQHHHALRVHDLLEEHFHHRRGVRVQALVALAHIVQVGPAERREVGRLDARQADVGAAFVRLVDHFFMDLAERQRRGHRPLDGVAPAAAR